MLKKVHRLGEPLRKYCPDDSLQGQTRGRNAQSRGFASSSADYTQTAGGRSNETLEAPDQGPATDMWHRLCHARCKQGSHTPCVVRFGASYHGAASCDRRPSSTERLRDCFFRLPSALRVQVTCLRHSNSYYDVRDRRSPTLSLPRRCSRGKRVAVAS